MRKYDFVKIIEVEDEVMEQFLGTEGMIIDIDTSYEYPIEVCLFDKELQERIVDEGNLMFKESELEII